MREGNWSLRALGAALALGAGCTIDDLDATGKACPCPSGLTCDRVTQTCVHGGSAGAPSASASSGAAGGSGGGMAGASSVGSGGSTPSCAGTCGTPGCGDCPNTPVVVIDGYD